MEKKFRSFEQSDPSYGFKNLRFVTIKSDNLHGRGDICLYIPDNCPSDAPVVILLHGVYGSAWSWALSSGVHEQVDQAISAGLIKPLILVMPSDGLWGDGSGYMKQKKQDFEQWIVEEVIEATRQIATEQVTEASKFFIAGLSMGGYGAIRLGARHPNLFTSFSGLSSITDISDFSLFVEESLSNYQMDTELSLIDTIVANRAGIPFFRFDCGRDDLLIEQNRKLHKQLLEANIAHVYQEYEGGHSWDYWKNNVMKTILFFNLRF
ncbi:prolyl oligopeptidase family serine peptidase [Sphingobacterium sp. DK4209]|uniref:Prolyl oligopeptidase family serine peptidase n=1 Tax=Sphingobacterium zhuxiongii TaxID=2662364 RepID=A0A5Q0Q6J5_9SPHI|nr:MULTISPECIES: alpha/beta hydrolase-fold protein [unclassified Sphingobacterium]MVZ66252.1 prolyl oligopeptidase family serine peptidase [Sphingobacterium sp. DK4209]QGA24976.1 prolyl oligopeptidase family serine peptidase [Sphingobacterium sp. dk4302]